MNKLIAEFLGSLFLGMTAILTGDPLAMGAVLAVCSYTFGYVSGGHFNPAVTLAVWMRGRMDKPEMLRFWAAQFAGAVAASLLTVVLRPDGAVPGPLTGPLGKAAAGEFLGSLLLVSALLHTTTSRQLKGNAFYGLTIGLALSAGAALTLRYSGGALNPATGLAFILAGKSGMVLLPVYLVSCCAGGAVAALLFRLLNPND